MAVPDFSEALRLLSTYRYRHRGADGPLSNAIAEAQKRLEQLDAIVQRVDRLQRVQDRVDGWQWRADVPEHVARARHARRARAREAIGGEIEILSEAFYYFAWRLRELLVRLPHLKKFNPRGIREVRHDLLEHPERKSKALNPNFMYGLDVQQGPVLKPFGERRADVHDRGLYVNAQEILDELVPRLTAAAGDAARRDARETRSNRRMHPTAPTK